jgi:hypothetical protein
VAALPTSVADYAPFFDVAQKLTATFAFAAGGSWVLMNYIRDRTHAPRLQVEVDEKIAYITGRHCLLVTSKVQNRRTPYPLDRAAYKRRNVIERLFCKLKNWRRVATRYDRLARNYLSGLALAAIIIAWT